MDEISEKLRKQYGFLMTLAELAKLLDRSEGGILYTMRRSTELASQLRDARVRIGRRVHFRTQAIAALIQAGTDAAAAEQSSSAEVR